MSFLKNLKSAFGFSESELENEVNNDDMPDATVTPLRSRQNAEAKTDKGVDTSMATKPQAVSNGLPELPDAVPDEIFDTVVKIFNDSQPEFIKSSLDEAAQRKYLYESLSASMKAYIANLTDIVEERTRLTWENDRNRLNREMQSIKEQSKKIETSNAEWKEQKLSAERQKRALSERVHDLEAQIASFQAEKEQYELENKSLINKIKVMAVQNEDSETLRKDNESLRAEINRMKASAVSATAPGDPELEAKIKSLETENAKVSEEYKQLADEYDQLTSECDKLKSDIDTMRKRAEIADAMINDLNHRASTAQKSLAERENELVQTKSALEAASDASPVKTLEEENNALALNLKNSTEEVIKLKAELEDKDKEMADLSEQLKTTNEELEEAHGALQLFETTLTQFEQVKKNKDTRIADLQATLTEKTAEIERLTTELSEQAKKQQAESNETEAQTAKIAEYEKTLAERDEQIASLKSTIENNLKLQAQSESALRLEIDQLRRSSDNDKPRRRKPQYKSTALDDAIDDTDWLVGTPPEGTNARISGVSDSEFGYQEPPVKRHNDDPAQMSLW